MLFRDVVSNTQLRDRHGLAKQGNRRADVTPTFLRGAEGAVCLGHLAIQAPCSPGFGSRAYAGGVVRDDLPLPALGLARHGAAFPDFLHGASPPAPLGEPSPSDA